MSDSDKKSVEDELKGFMLEKSNSANVEPVFTDNEGNEHCLDDASAMVVDNILEQAFIPFLAEALAEEGYRKPETCEMIEEKPLKERTAIDHDFKCGCSNCLKLLTIKVDYDSDKIRPWAGEKYCPYCGAKIIRFIRAEEVS